MRRSLLERSKRVAELCEAGSQIGNLGGSDL
jgi:hypothetical protein